MNAEQRLRTVVVDDDAGARFLLRHQLERSSSFEVVGEGEDGEHAVALAAELRPDVVLMDLNMPGMDGLTALPLVQEVLGGDAAVVVMSAAPSEAATRAVAEGRAKAFLEKSVGYDGLVRDLLELLDHDATPDDAVAWHLPADLQSCAVAREHLRDVLAAWDLAQLLDEVELLATELITNAILHAGSEVDLTVKRRRDRVRVEVTDHGEGQLERVDAELGDTHGRGLFLVEAMASSWGTASSGEEKTVWFEVAPEASPAVG